MKKILFPTDFSEVANNAFIHALEFAKVVNGEILLLHTFDLPFIDNQFAPENYYTIFDSLQLAHLDAFKEEIPKMREIAKQHNLEEIKLTHKLIDGDLVYSIKEVVIDQNIDFVVMGTSGSTGWETFLIGTNTGAVVTGVSVPVLSVPLEAKFKKIQTIGFTTRFRDKDKKSLRKVIDIAKKTNAVIKCLYVKTSHSDVTEDTINHWKMEFENEPVTFSIIENSNVKETIIDFVSNKNIDILTMITHKRGFFAELFNSSLTKEFSNTSSIPVLALHEDE